jgi:hypothetical protein
MKVFVAGVDTPFGHNLSQLLSNTAIGSRKEENEEDGEEPKEVTESNSISKLTRQQTQTILRNSGYIEVE